MGAPDDDASRMVTVRVPSDLYRSVRAYASLADVSLNALVVEAVVDYLERHASDEAITALVEQHRASLRGARKKP